MGLVKYITTSELQLLAAQAKKSRYNRQLTSEFVKRLTEDTPKGTKFPILYMLRHHHIAGQPAPVHVRIVFTHNSQGSVGQLDISTAAWNALSSAEVPGSQGTVDISAKTDIHLTD